MKSKSAEAKAIIMNILNDGNAHSAEEFRKKLQEKGVSQQSADSAIRNAIYKIKKEDSRFMVIKRGVYCLKNHITGFEQTGVKHCEETEEKGIKLEGTTEYDKIRSRIEYLKTFNWVTCSDEDLTNARQEVKKLVELEQWLTDFFETYNK